LGLAHPDIGNFAGYHARTWISGLAQGLQQQGAEALVHQAEDRMMGDLGGFVRHQFQFFHSAPNKPSG